LVSIDSHSLAEHERNRGLLGVGERIWQGVGVARRNGIHTMACVTVSRLVKFEALPDLLKRLGFDAVVFSWPRRAGHSKRASETSVGLAPLPVPDTLLVARRGR
jgi:hypothetical protein